MSYTTRESMIILKDLFLDHIIFKSGNISRPSNLSVHDYFWEEGIHWNKVY